MPGESVPLAVEAQSATWLRMSEAEDTLRAIRAGEVDAFVLEEDGKHRVFSLATADRPYRIFVENMRDGAATVSSGGTILFANRRLAELLSRSRDAIVGMPLDRFVRGGIPGGVAGLRNPDRLSQSAEWELVADGGGDVPVMVGSAALEMDGDFLTCLTFTDLTAHKAQAQAIAELSQAQAEQMVDLRSAQAALVVQATHDGLTGLPNRALLVDRIEQALSAGLRSGGYAAVFFVDIDRFKQINDTQGHAAGDAVLQRVAARLLGVFRPMDTIARIGGDEFVVLARNVSSRIQAVELSERIVAAVSRPSGQPEEGERVTASVGVAVATGASTTAENLIREADTAMYKAKSLGGAQAAIFDEELGRQAQERSKAKLVLQSALDEHRVGAH
ncbi:MAG: hypothetical protein QOF76_2181, partial [Solirubrobacteraceae bacterium]|nr:hypothetical protein [Solirubrobacteraceae bacterium]